MSTGHLLLPRLPQVANGAVYPCLHAPRCPIHENPPSTTLRVSSDSCNTQIEQNSAFGADHAPPMLHVRIPSPYHTPSMDTRSKATTRTNLALSYKRHRFSPYATDPRSEVVQLPFHRPVAHLQHRRHAIPHETSSPYSHRWICMDKGEIASLPNPKSPALIAPIGLCPHRLIDTYSIELVEFSKDTIIPPYAILSHMWSEGQEVVYKEFLQPREETKSKSGYWKIQAACRQARLHGIGYIWIDTCCIEQGNHADVSVNIASMYAFYQNAEVCYAYLVDVMERRDMFGEPYWVYSGTKWLQRGWTLQELLAPQTVIFFNKHWQKIGDKHKFRNDIHRKTTISPDILLGRQSIQDVDVMTRMSWAIWRRTTRPQDQAYCLQGLLGVSIEPDYEELHFASFNRLGKALFEIRPELKERLGISDDWFRDPNDNSFWFLVASG